MKTVMNPGVSIRKIQWTINIMNCHLEKICMVMHWKKFWMKTFYDYSTDIVVKKLAPGGNSQRNEALKSVFASNNPKMRHYGGSKSNDYRVACGVSQTNEGYSYVCQTLQEINIEPGQHCIDHSEAMNEKSLRDKVRKSSIDYKRRRTNLYRRKINSNARKEAKEGTTYKTGVGLNLDPSCQNTPTNLLKLTEDVTHSMLEEYEKLVPPFVKRPIQPKVTYNTSASRPPLLQGKQRSANFHW